MKMKIIRSHPYYDVMSNGDIVFSKTGKEYYQPYFARLGFSISTVNSIRKLSIASKLILPLELEQIDMSNNKPVNSIENRWFNSLLDGDIDEYNRLTQLLERVKSSKLRIVK